MHLFNTHIVYCCSMSANTSNKVLFWLRFFCFFLLFGRAWQHLRWDAPFRALLWDQNIMEAWVTQFTSYEWSEWIRSETVDGNIQNWIMGFGLLYLVGAIGVLLVNKKWPRKPTIFFFGMLTSCLMFLAFLYCKEKFYHGGQFLEYAIQFSLPSLLVYAIFYNALNDRYQFVLKLVIGATFLGHGLYALGYYPVPGNFVQMTLSIFPFFSESAAFLYLKIAGILDLLAVVFLFIPRLVKPAVYYCIGWGFLTACARVLANFYPELWLDSIDQWLPETLYRLGHGGVPLILLFLINQKNQLKT